MHASAYGRLVHYFHLNGEGSGIFLSLGPNKQRGATCVGYIYSHFQLH